MQLTHWPRETNFYFQIFTIMPQKCLPFRLEMEDGRRKIPQEEHPKIQKLYKEGLSQRAIARQYNVSRRLIVWILYPERLKARQAQRILDKAHLLYYDKQKHRLSMQKHRLKKRQLGYMIFKTPQRHLQVDGK